MLSSHDNILPNGNALCAVARPVDSGRRPSARSGDGNETRVQRDGQRRPGEWFEARRARRPADALALAEQDGQRPAHASDVNRGDGAAAARRARERGARAQGEHATATAQGALPRAGPPN